MFSAYDEISVYDPSSRGPVRWKMQGERETVLFVYYYIDASNDF